MSGHVDLSRLRELCLESLARPGGSWADAMMLDLVDQLIALCGSSRAASAAFSVRHQRCGYRPACYVAGVRAFLTEGGKPPEGSIACKGYLDAHDMTA